MASRAFIATEDLTSWGQLKNPPATAVLQAVEGACAALENRIRCRILAGSYAVWHSGDRAVEFAGVKSDLYLCDPDRGLLTIPVYGTPTVTEEGTSLTAYLMSAATSFTDSDDAVLIFDREGIVRRVSISDGIPEPKSWESGIANIRLSYTAGFAKPSESESNPMVPYDLIQAALNLAMLFFREGSRAGLVQANDGLMSVGYERLLPPVIRDTIESYTFPAVPRTYEG